MDKLESKPVHTYIYIHSYIHYELRYEIAIHKIESLGMDESFYSKHYGVYVCGYVCTLGLKLIHVSKMSPWYFLPFLQLGMDRISA